MEMPINVGCSEAEDELVPGAGDRTKPLPPNPHPRATECVVVISWEILVTTLAEAGLYTKPRGMCTGT